jgi:carbon dioxide concentrating mechanism protein CcmO
VTTLTTSDAVGIIEIGAWSVGMAATDAAAKAADVRVIGAELNDMLGVCVRVAGDVANVRAAVDAADALARACHVSVFTSVIPRPHPHAGNTTIVVRPEYNALIEQDVAQIPRDEAMADNNYAIGFIETQGFTAVIEAVDAACKAANVEIVGREKLGGGYVSVIIRGDVAAVRAAVDAAKPRVEGLGKLIATHVIARPSPSVLALLPKT